MSLGPRRRRPAAAREDHKVVFCRHLSAFVDISGRRKSTKVDSGATKAAADVGLCRHLRLRRSRSAPRNETAKSRTLLSAAAEPTRPAQPHDRPGATKLAAMRQAVDASRSIFPIHVLKEPRRAETRRPRPDPAPAPLLEHFKNFVKREIARRPPPLARACRRA
jgi:hypothetical protein